VSGNEEDPMKPPGGTDRLPASVKLAAALILLYGAAALLNATVMEGAGGWTAVRGEYRAVIRLLFAGAIAWGLLRRAPWAWWLGIVLAVFWLGTGVLAVAVLERGDVYWLAPSGFQILLAVALLSLGMALALLLSPSARRTFRRGSVG
jgi:hypothetical protein